MSEWYNDKKIFKIAKYNGENDKKFIEMLKKPILSYMIINRTDNAGILTVLRSGCLICNLHQEKRKGNSMHKKEELLKRCTEILSKELPVLRKINNLTQKDLGDIIGVSRQTVTNIESGKSEMKWTTFLAIMFVFSLDHSSVEYLRRLDIPYAEIKQWLAEKRGEK
ncbi:helix-turn-helix transcriptional regulator [Claveliimonas sp.]